MTTRTIRLARLLAIAAPLAAVLIGCPRSQDAPPPAAGGGVESEPVKITNRIPIPDSVRRNLGITFATVQMRRVVSTLRYPGQFELTPGAWSSYHARLGGLLTLHVAQYQTVAAGDLLATLETPEWRESQEAINEAAQAIATANAGLKVAAAARAEAEAAIAVAAKRELTVPARTAAVEAHRTGLRAALEVWSARETELMALAQGGAGMSSQLADARGELASLRTQLKETDEELAEIAHEVAGYRLEVELLRTKLPALDAQLQAATVEVENATAHQQMVVASAATRIGVMPAWLLDMLPGDGKPIARWQQISGIEIRATRAGMVHDIAATTGAWLDAGAQVMRTLDPSAIRFRANGLQGDLPHLADGMAARIVPPPGSSVAFGEFGTGIAGTLQIGVEADALERTIDLIVKPAADAALPVWARNGVSAQVEVVIDGSDEPTMAIPERCVVTDGTDRIFFRRDPLDKDKAIRLVADLGPSDGKWVAIQSGVAIDDEVVLDGVYPLKLSGSGKAPQGGHFHADGTWHAGADH
ncbi:MAG: efflux RND transporter periplasmic adaptor subunit [Planctomycetota bacterium]